MPTIMKAAEVLSRYADGDRDFRRANLQGQSFKGQDLSGADFSEADLRGAKFAEAILSGVNFTKAKAGLQPYSALILVLLSGIVAYFSGFLSSMAALTWWGLMFEILSREPYATPSITASSILFFIFLIVTFNRNLVSGLIGYSISFTLIFAIAIVFHIGGVSASSGIVAGAFFGAVSLTWTTFVSNSKITAIVVYFIGIVAGIFTTLSIVRANTQPELFDFVAFSFLLGSVIGVFFTVVLSVIFYAFTLLEDERFSFIYMIALIVSSLNGTSFEKSNLSETVFREATLDNTNLSKANLIKVSLHEVQDLARARVGNSCLRFSQIRQLVTTLQGQGQRFDHLNLSGINLSSAKLQGASFIGCNLNDASFQDADLSRAILKQTQLDGADLTRATLTGAYIEDWGITGSTKLDDLCCKYVYMHVPTTDDPDPIRKPDNRSEEFEDGDFADFIQPIIDTLDLYHNQGVDPRAIAIAFKDLAENNADAKLEIVALEKRGQDKFLLRAKTAATADKSQLSAEYFDRYNHYKALSEQQQALLIEKDSRIEQLATMVVTSLQRSTFYTETNIQQVGNMMSNPGGISQSNTGSMSGGMQAALGNHNQQNMTTEVSSAKMPDTTEVLSLLAELETLIHVSALPEADKAKATNYLVAAKTEATEAEPDKDLFVKNLERTAKTLKTADEAMETGTSLFEKAVPILKAIVPWLGKATGALLALLA